MTRMSDLPQELVAEIVTRVPITSLKAVRSTCKTWEAITKKSMVVLGKAARHQGFVTMNSKVYSLRYQQQEEDLVSVKQVDLLNELEITKVYHCDGLVLCIPKDNNSQKLVLWNPYLCQTRLIGPPREGENFNRKDSYAIGYNNKKLRDHKVLRFVNEVSVFRCEIYEIGLSNSSWRVLNVNPEWEIDEHQRGVSVKGNTYFFAHQKYEDLEPDYEGEVEDFLLCFDFTKESFGPRLPLPFHSDTSDCITLSSFLRYDDDDDEQLAVLFGNDMSDSFQIWVTLTVEPDHVSWSKFLLVETEPLIIGLNLNFKLDSFFGGSFFVDEANKVVVVFELDHRYHLSTMTAAPLQHHTAFVFGEDGYFQSVNLGEATKLQQFVPITNILYEAACPPLFCTSSYRPSLVQVKQESLLHKRKRTHA